MSGGFLGRWSRRKLAGAGKTLLADAPASGPLPTTVVGHGVAAASVSAAAEPAPAERDAGTPAAEAQLPPVEALTLESDFTAFLKEEVSEALRRKALHKLFADPHFNRMDGLDVYIDDYSLPDPIPPEAMAKLQHAREWLMANEPEVDAEVAGSSAGQAAGARPAGDEGAMPDAPGGVGADARSADEPAKEPGAGRGAELADEHGPGPTAAGREPWHGPGATATDDASEPAAGASGACVQGKDDRRRTGGAMQGGDDALPAAIPPTACEAIRSRQKAP